MYPIIYWIGTVAGAFRHMSHGMWVTGVHTVFEGTFAVPHRIANVFYHARPQVLHALRHGKECKQIAHATWRCVKNQIGVGGHG